MSNAKNVTAAKPNTGGALYVAPLGTTLPSDPTTELPSTYKSLGYFSEDGLTNSNTSSSESVKAWGGDTVLTYKNDSADEFTYKLIEGLNVDVLKEVYGDSNVEVQSDGTIKVYATTDEATAKVYVFCMVLKDGRAKRIVVPNGKLSSIGEIPYKDQELVGFDCTLSAISYNDGSRSYTHFELIEKEK